jgi:hypothetical protein
MNYFVQKGDQRLGPFTLVELHAQAQSGKIARTDLAQSEGMSEWVPVSQVLGNIPVPAVTSYGASAAPAMEPAPRLVPLPANLHWLILLVLDIISRNLFNLIWALYLAHWARKLQGENKPLILVSMYPAGIIAGMIASLNHNEIAGGILILAGAITYLFGVFSIRSEMEDYYNSTENIGLTLSGPMTFFFSTIYLQYHINRIAKMKKAGTIS